MEKYVIRKIGENKGARRIWLEGKVPSKAGLIPGMMYRRTVTKETCCILLEAVELMGTHTVSRKQKNGHDIPVIDLNSNEDLSIFEGMNTVRVVVKKGKIYILPLASELKARERLKRLRNKLEQNIPLAMGSLTHGGGVLSLALHTGLAQAGVKTSLVFANDIREELLDQAEDYNDAWDSGTCSISAPMQELANDEWALSQLGNIDILEAGLCCSGASVAGRSKLGLNCPEAHPDVGHLLVSFLAIIGKLQPSIVILENVKPFQSAASMHIIRSQLRDLGYDVREELLQAGDWNVLEHRERMCMVATTRGMPVFDFSLVEKPAKVERCLGEILEPIAEDDPRWSEMKGLKEKEVRDKAAGKGFTMQIVGPESTRVPTITKGYAKVRSTDPKVSHPSNPQLLRQFTPGEHADIKGIVRKLISNMSATLAHELLGQSICLDPFVAVGKAAGKLIHRFFDDEEVLPNMYQPLHSA